jgi:hypothetical protein
MMRLAFLVVLSGSHDMVVMRLGQAGLKHTVKKPWPGIGDGKFANLFLQCMEPVVLRLQ